MANAHSPKNASGMNREKAQFQERQFGDAGQQFEQVMAYIKENWRTILSEVVAAAVTAYLAHQKQTKVKKNENRQQFS